MIDEKNLTMVHPYTGNMFDACIKVVNIRWDLDEEEEYLRQDLPTEKLVWLTYIDTEENVNDLFNSRIADELSYYTGWCVDSFDIEVIIQVKCKE